MRRMCKFCDTFEDIRKIQKSDGFKYKNRAVIETETIYEMNGNSGYTLHRERFDLNYCPECGKKLVSGEEGTVKYKPCPCCGTELYEYCFTCGYEGEKIENVGED